MTISLEALIASACADYLETNPDASVAPGTSIYQNIANQQVILLSLYNMKQFISGLGCNSPNVAGYAKTFGVLPAPNETASSFFNRFIITLERPIDLASYFASWAKNISVSNWEAWQPQTAYVAGQVCMPFISQSRIAGYHSEMQLSSAGSYVNVPVPIYSSVGLTPVSNGHLYTCTIGGTSGAETPAWTVEPGDTVTDSNVTWREWNVASYVEKVNLVTCVLNSRGLGTIDIAITSDSPCDWMENEPTSAIISAISSQFSTICQIMGLDLLVLVAAKKIEGISLTVPVGTLQATKDNLAFSVSSYVQSLLIGVSLDPTQFKQIAFSNGLLGIACLAPSEKVTCFPTGNPGSYEHFWADTSDITITEA